MLARLALVPFLFYDPPPTYIVVVSYSYSYATHVEATSVYVRGAVSKYHERGITTQPNNARLFDSQEDANFYIKYIELWMKPEAVYGPMLVKKMGDGVEKDWKIVIETIRIDPSL